MRHIVSHTVVALAIAAMLSGCDGGPGSPTPTTTTTVSTTTTTEPATTTTTTTIATTSTTSTVSSTTTTTSSIPVTPFYGKYNVSFHKVSDTGCDITFQPTGTVTLSGNATGSSARIDVFERAEREYRGSIDTSGRFSGSGSGITPGLAGPASPNKHDYSGKITGRVTGRDIEGRETITFGAGCPGHVVVLDFKGSR